MSLLNDTEIEKKLKKIDSWFFEENIIRKSFSFPNYMEGVEFVNKVAILSEKKNHHPDIFLEWCKVSLSFTSHDEGGVTQACIDMADKINKIIV